MATMFQSVTYPNIEKPFNPILGETFQTTLDGIPVYWEQISHHPPISAYYMKNDQFSRSLPKKWNCLFRSQPERQE